MPLTDYRTLGRSGLVVSPLTLGTMTFGTKGWGADETTAHAIFDRYRAAGGTVIDTADVYAAGEGERMVGRFIAGARDEVVLATKYGFSGGSGVGAMHRALDGSLRRLGTDHIDLYWMHVWDGVTPVEEIVGALGDLVRVGKIRYFGLSDVPAWVAAKAGALAQARGTPGPVALQLEYSLIARDIEAEHVPAARDGAMAVVPWSPLGGGFLTGKYRRDATGGAGRLSGPNPFGNSEFTERNWAVLDVLADVATELERPLAQVALAWLLGRPGVTTTVVGASRPEQLDDAIAALDLRLGDDQRRRLDEAGAPAPGFTAGLAAAGVRRAIFGGRDVIGWSA